MPIAGTVMKKKIIFNAIVTTDIKTRTRIDVTRLCALSVVCDSIIISGAIISGTKCPGQSLLHFFYIAPFRLVACLRR